MAESIEEPGYSADESTKEGFVRLRVKLDGLKVHSVGIFDRIKHSHPLPKGKNADISLPSVSESGFHLVVKGSGTGEMKGAHYSLQIKQLPFAISPTESYLTGSEGWIEVFLKKQDVNQSWEKYIRSGSVETSED